MAELIKTIHRAGREGREGIRGRRGSDAAQQVQLVFLRALRVLPGALIFCVLAMVPGGLAAQTACKASQATLQSEVQAVHEKQKNVGLYALVLAGGKPVLALPLGYADLEHQVPVDATTRFGIASITKAFTGISL